MAGKYGMSRVFAWLGAVVLLAAASAVPAWASQQQENGAGKTAAAESVAAGQQASRTLLLRHRWARERLKVVYRIGDAYQPEAMAKINHFLRDRRCGRTIGIDPKLIDLLYELQQEFGGKRMIRVISAYRSEGYNASLLRAGRIVDPHSTHMRGQAADIFIRGVPLERLREAAIRRKAGGVGIYPFSWPAFIHVDTGRVRQWAEPDPKEAKDAARPTRKRLRVDCDLKMADVFAQVPEEQAIAALPPGASVKSRRIVQNASHTGRPPIPLVLRASLGTSIGMWAVEGPACKAADPLQSLALLRKMSAPAKAAPKPRRRVKRRARRRRATRRRRHR